MNFDPAKFLNQQVSGPMSTYITPCPEGDWPFKVADDDKYAEVRTVTTKDGDRPVLRIKCECLSDQVRTQLGRDKVFCNYDAWLDLDKNGQMDMSEGMNTGLGRIREALGQNGPNPWGIPMLRGAGPFQAKVSQRSDEKDPKVKYAQIDRVAKIT